MGYQPFICSMFSLKEKDLRLQLGPSTSSSMKLSLRDVDSCDAWSMFNLATSAGLSPPEGSTSNGIMSGNIAINNQHCFVRRDDSGLSSLARYKGVAPQQNGHWDAQIYVNHGCIWLGTFRTEWEAAMAYDSAALKLNPGVNMHRNFPLTEITVHEPNFQKLLSTEAVLGMIRDGSYQKKFMEFHSQMRASMLAAPNTTKIVSTLMGTGNRKFIRLFEKELTRSDVGRLNRLVVQSKYARKYFPPVSEGSDISLEFKDLEGQLWTFKYNYWPSSKSYVFKSGWNIFVKQQKLKTKDAVVFYCCGEGGRKEYIIEVIHKNAGDVDEISAETGEGEVESKRVVAREEEEEPLAEEEEEEIEPVAKKLKLFGFWVA